MRGPRARMLCLLSLLICVVHRSWEAIKQLRLSRSRHRTEQSKSRKDNSTGWPAARNPAALLTDIINNSLDECVALYARDRPPCSFSYSCVRSLCALSSFMCAANRHISRRDQTGIDSIELRGGGVVIMMCGRQCSFLLDVVLLPPHRVIVQRKLYPN